MKFMTKVKCGHRLYRVEPRYFSSEVNKDVRVRFAPSPTGHLHLGGYRTALYNGMFARVTGGKFILRIEDTDQNRVVEGAEERLESVLTWAGIQPDESPLRGGEYGPYRQSDRLEIYNKYVQQLLDTGHAYRCFCSERRLDLLRKEAARSRTVNKYDRKCLPLSKEEVEEKLHTNLPHTIRFKLTPHPHPFTDLVYGEVTHDVFQFEGDPIIVKSDGYPTYHLANVIDDHLMAITHVLRGVEWQVSTPKHLLMYKAFGWEAPSFAHLPLVMNKDGSKLSKRQNDLHLDTLRKQGFMPESIANFMSLVGGGFDKEYSLDKVYSLDHLGSVFKLTKVHTQSGRIEMERLDMINRLFLKEKLNDDKKKVELIRNCRDIIIKASEELNFKIENVDNKTIEKNLRWAEDRINKVTEIVNKEFLFLWVSPSSYSIPISLTNSLIDKVIDLMVNLEEGDSKSLPKYLKKVCQSEKDLKFSQMMKELRVLITGCEEGPPIVELVEVLGTQTVISRLENYQNIH